MLTPILHSTTVCIHMNRSSMHRVIHWTPAWMTVNMMTLKQATSIITSMIPGEKMSPFASQSKAPVNMKQAISLGSWWATTLGLTVKWAAGASWTNRFSFKVEKKGWLWDHFPFALGCKHVSFPKMMGFCGAPRKLHVVIPHLTAKHWNTVNNLAQLQRCTEPTVINLPRNWKGPNSFHLQLKTTAKNIKQNISKLQLLTLTPPTPGQHEICQSGCKVRTPQKSIAADSSVTSRRYIESGEGPMNCYQKTYKSVLEVVHYLSSKNPWI